MNIHSVFHVTLLEPHHENTIPNQIQPPLSTITIGKEIEYEIEKVLDSKISRRKLLYFVKWKGYPTSENSWEPIENLKHFLDLTWSFYKKHPTKPASALTYTHAPPPTRKK